VLSGEGTNTNFIVFGLTRPGLESTIYRNQGDHSNHYAAVAVHLEMNSEGRLRTKLYDTRNDFNVLIVNFPFIFNISAATAYGVHISLSLHDIPEFVVHIIIYRGLLKTIT
jgi:hypothetical protein